MIALLLGLSVAAASWPEGDSMVSDGPIRWRVVEPDAGILPEGALRDAFERGLDHWREAAPCAVIQDEFLGMEDAAAEPAEGEALLRLDSAHELPTGVVVRLECDLEFAYRLNGTFYYTWSACDIVLGTGVAWATTEDIASGDCLDGWSVEAAATRIAGLLLGVDDHESLVTEVCTLPDPWVSQDAAVEVGSLHGLNTFWQLPESDLFGAVPLDVCLSLRMSSDPDDVTVTWEFGDGATAESALEEQVCHTYGEQGAYDIAYELHRSGVDCGGFSWGGYSRDDYDVLACLPPVADGDALFSVDVLGSRTLELVNHVDTSMPACLDTVRWQVFDGSTVIADIEAWAPIVEVPRPGTYTVVATMSGLGGETTESVEVTVPEQGGCGGRLAALLALPLLGLRRRPTVAPASSAGPGPWPRAG